jgi:hypothetical protein
VFWAVLAGRGWKGGRPFDPLNAGQPLRTEAGRRQALCLLVFSATLRGEEVAAMSDAVPQKSTDRPGVPAAWRTLAIVLFVVVVLGGVGLALWQGSSDSETSGFPTGTFVSASGIVAVEFNENGTCRWLSDTEGWEVPCTYAVNGDLFTEMTFEWPSGSQVPATYYWTYDGENLTFELWGEDMRPHRQEVYDGQTYVTAE